MSEYSKRVQDLKSGKWNMVEKSRSWGMQGHILLLVILIKDIFFKLQSEDQKTMDMFLGLNENWFSIKEVCI